MAQSQFQLFRTRRFWPLFVTQALGAFNDNAFKNGLSILITYKLASEQSLNAATMISLAAGLFILPFFIFSGIAGQMADKFDKARLAQRIKLAEIVIMSTGAFSLWLEWVPLQLAVIFATGTQSAFFGPIKYGILPQHLEHSELVGGNALIEMGTFLTILLGTLFGGFVILTHFGVEWVAFALVALSTTGWLASRQIPTAVPPDPHIVLDFNLWRSTVRILTYATERRDVFLAILGISWFWFLGIVFLTEFPALAHNTLNAGEATANLFVVTFTIGIGAGSMLTNRLLKGEVSTRYVPAAAIAMTVAIIDLWFAASELGPALAGKTLAPVSAVVSAPGGWRIFIDLALISMFAGLYIVPLYAYMQAHSRPAAVSRVIASNNVVNAAFMTVATMLAIILLDAGMDVPQLFLTVGIAHGFVAIYSFRLLPDGKFKQICRRVLQSRWRPR